MTLLICYTPVKYKFHTVKLISEFGVIINRQCRLLDQFFKFRRACRSRLHISLTVIHEHNKTIVYFYSILFLITLQRNNFFLEWWIYFSAKSIYDELFFKRFRVSVSNKGIVNWVPGGKFLTSCQLDITYYPFDDQECHIDLVDWAYHGLQVNYIDLCVMHECHTVHIHYQNPYCYILYIACMRHRINTLLGFQQPENRAKINPLDVENWNLYTL